MQAQISLLELLKYTHTWALWKHVIVNITRDMTSGMAGNVRGSLPCITRCRITNWTCIIAVYCEAVRGRCWAGLYFYVWMNSLILMLILLLLLGRCDLLVGLMCFVYRHQYSDLCAEWRGSLWKLILKKLYVSWQQELPTWRATLCVTTLQHRYVIHES